MHIDYHIPVPHLTPTPEELVWAQENLMPHANQALEKLYEKYGAKFDKSNIDQRIFDSWSLTSRMREHLNELGMSLRKFAVFIGYQGAKAAVPHVDAQTFHTPMVARLNVPIQGWQGARLSWWKSGVEDPRMLVRDFEEWDAKTQSMRRGFSYLSDPQAQWGEPDHVEYNPGPCWNHVELAHKLDLDDITEHRVNITAEIEPQISWLELTTRLRSCGYIKD
jgi:hypothetical protein